jgi:N-formylglutamate deformylase
MGSDSDSSPSVFNLDRPAEQISSAVFSSPHSGAEYPKDMLARTHLSDQALRSSEDAFIDELVASAPAYGAPLISARMPRAWIDLNRAADELDPALIAGAPKANRSPRINAGLGVIPRVVSDSRIIMSGKMTLSEAKARVEAYHKPYHQTLDALLTETRDMFGHAILFDCHSMPHDALAGSTMVNGARPEIVLGDRFGASCERWVMDAAMDIFANAGFRVVRNAPFAGGYITQTYGRPSRGIHALQIEIDRSLYMDEPSVTKSQRFPSFQRQLNEIVRKLARIGREQLSIAAE